MSSRNVLQLPAASPFLVCIALWEWDVLQRVLRILLFKKKLCKPTTYLKVSQTWYEAVPQPIRIVLIRLLLNSSFSKMSYIYANYPLLFYRTRDKYKQSKDSKCTIKHIKEKHEILTFEKLKPLTVWTCHPLYDCSSKGWVFLCRSPLWRRPCAFVCFRRQKSTESAESDEEDVDELYLMDHKEIMSRITLKQEVRRPPPLTPCLEVCGPRIQRPFIPLGQHRLKVTESDVR